VLPALHLASRFDRELALNDVAHLLIRDGTLIRALIEDPVDGAEIAGHNSRAQTRVEPVGRIADVCGVLLRLDLPRHEPGDLLGDGSVASEDDLGSKGNERLRGSNAVLGGSSDIEEGGGRDVARVLGPWEVPPAGRIDCGSDGGLHGRQGGR
jgi:hypothetical protein